MDEKLEELLKKELEEKQKEKRKKEELEKKAIEEIRKTKKFIWITLAIIAIIVTIIITIQSCKPKDYEYKMTGYEIMQFDDTKGIISIEIKNNTNKKSTIYIQVRIYDSKSEFLTYGEAAFTPLPNSIDVYQMTIQSPYGSLRGSTAKIFTFNVLNI